MDNQDLRVQRTRRLLKEAFTQLIIEKGFEDTSIRDVTDRAEIGYRTFFRHYSDLKSLLHDILKDITDEMQGVMIPSRNPDVVEANLLQWYKIIGEHADLYRVLFRAPNYQELIEPLIEFTQKSSRGVFKKVGIPEEIIITHTVSASLSLIRFWVESDMEVSPEEMARYTIVLVVRPVFELIPT